MLLNLTQAAVKRGKEAQEKEKLAKEKLAKEKLAIEKAAKEKAPIKAPEKAGAANI